jgi:hypothetical protein
VLHRRLKTVRRGKINVKVAVGGNLSELPTSSRGDLSSSSANGKLQTNIIISISISNTNNKATTKDTSSSSSSSNLGEDLSNLKAATRIRPTSTEIKHPRNIGILKDRNSKVSIFDPSISSPLAPQRGNPIAHSPTSPLQEQTQT